LETFIKERRRGAHIVLTNDSEVADRMNQRAAAQGESEGNRLVVDDFIIRVAAACVSGGITNAEFNALVGIWSRP